MGRYREMRLNRWAGGELNLTIAASARYGEPAAGRAQLGAVDRHVAAIGSGTVKTKWKYWVSRSSDGVVPLNVENGRQALLTLSL